MTRREAFLAISGLALSARTLAMQINASPFTLGVASGDPMPDRVVIWTRLAPNPLEGGGMPSQPVEVNWRVGLDERLSRVIKQGTTTARPEFAHSVHVDVTGLAPARWYWYQFNIRQGASRIESPIGRTKTAPTPQAMQPLRFAFASCQKYEDGYFTAYQRMCEEDLDLVVHLGDYIYEDAAGANKPRPHPEQAAVTLEQYRHRYALYKTDSHLQRVHALFPWAVTWDDHEVADNYAALIPELDSARSTFPQRRAAAYQAYYEHMPLRAASRPRGFDMQLYRRLRFGGLAQFHMLDTRQYRTDQPCGDREKAPCDDRVNAAATIMGKAQEAWLLDGLAESRAKWNILAQQVIFSQFDLDPGPAQILGMDKWDGYFAARDRLLGFVADRKPSNPVVITGDNHNNWVFDVKRDFADERSPTIATEFAGTSITSGGDGGERAVREGAAVEANPHLKFHNSYRGYVRCVLTEKLWQSDFRVVPYVSKPDAPISTAASFAVEDGKPGAQRI